MFKFIKSLLSPGRSPEMDRLLKEGAKVVDVRTPGEFSQNHVSGSVNIPLPTIAKNLKKFKNSKQPIILCCASGNRSGQALRFLKKNGIDNVYNGGSWKSLT